MTTKHNELSELVSPKAGKYGEERKDSCDEDHRETTLHMDERTGDSSCCTSGFLTPIQSDRTAKITSQW